MKNVMIIILIISLLFTSCTIQNQSSDNENQNETTINSAEPLEFKTIIPEFTNLEDENLHYYLEDIVYEELITNLDNENYVIEDVNVTYISKEYIEEKAYNSQSTSYFGYTIDQLDEIFDGNKYVFTLSDENTTIVKELEEIEKTSKEIMLENILVGSGVIIITSTLSLVSPVVGMPAAVQVILAGSAEGAATIALSSAAFSGSISAISEMVVTGDFNQAADAFCMDGSEAFKWGAISGAVTGGIDKGFQLKSGTKGGLTMNEVATIQKESKYPVDIIQNINSMEQYNICQKAGLEAANVNGKTALIRNIDLNYVDEITGKTNLELMQMGKSPLDPTGQKYELHHIGQKIDSPLAILEKSEHVQNGNNSIWHILTGGYENPSSQVNWSVTRSDFWKAMAEAVA